MMPRRNTLEEIAALDARVSHTRRKGVAAVLGGTLTVVLLATAIVLLGREQGSRAPSVQPTRQAPPPVAAPPTPTPAPTARPEPVPMPALSIAPRPPPKEPAQGPPELPRPASAVGPSLRAQKVDAESLARSLADQKKGAVQLCFEHELKRNPHLSGSATVSLELKAPHRLGRVEVKDSLHRKGFTRCVTRAMRSVQFPELRQDLSVELPFALRPHEF
jgi:hypothetical protein